MSISNSGGPPSSTASIWRELVSTRMQATQEQANWKVGETLQARVQALLPPAQDSANPPPSGQNRLILQIGGRLVETLSDLPVKPGDVIKVTFQADQQLLLQNGVHRSAMAAALKALLPQTLLDLSQTAASPTTQPRVQDALSRVMPFQGRLLETLTKLFDIPQDSLKPETAHALQQLRMVIPQAKDLVSPESLKQALRQSGAFAEKQMLTASASPVATDATGTTAESPKDLKHALLRVFTALAQPGSGLSPKAGGASPAPPPSPSAVWQSASAQIQQPLMFPHPEFLKLQVHSQSKKEELSTGDMLKLVAQALSRIQTTQLNAVQLGQGTPDAPPVNTWLLELPVFNHQQLNLFQLRIEEEPKQQSQDSEEKEGRKQESIWRLTLSFNLEPLGPMYSLVRIQRGRVSSTFWAEKDSTKTLLERELPQLRKALVKLGLEVDSLEALQGQPSFTQTRLETHLIDVRT